MIHDTVYSDWRQSHFHALAAFSIGDEWRTNCMVGQTILAYILPCPVNQNLVLRFE